MTRRTVVEPCALLSWLAGAGAIYAAWHIHLSDEIADTVYGFILYLIAFFYFLALMPIRKFLDDRIP